MRRFSVDWWNAMFAAVCCFSILVLIASIIWAIWAESGMLIWARVAATAFVTALTTYLFLKVQEWWP